MANIKDGLGTESPPTSCTNGLVAACRAEPRIWSVGIEYYIVSRCRLRPVPEVLVRKVVFVWTLFSYFKVALSYARARRSITNPHATGPVAQNENGPLVDVHHSTRRTDACHDASRTIRVHRPLSPSAGPDACLSRSSYRLQSPSAGGVAIPPAACPPSLPRPPPVHDGVGLRRRGLVGRRGQGGGRWPWLEVKGRYAANLLRHE